MTHTPFDEFSKGLLESLLTPFGSVEISREVPGEARLIDLYFSPTSGTSPDTSLGILARMAQTPCLIEPYRNPVSTKETKDCLLKLLAVQAKQTKDETLSNLWILTPTASQHRLTEFGASAVQDWPRGVYTFAPALQTDIVVIHQLPISPETLWLRLLGLGKVQQRAIEEVLALAPENPKRDNALQLLTSWKIMVDADEDVEVLMQLTQAYQEWEQKTKAEGRLEGRQQGESLLLLKILTRKFGQLELALRSSIEHLSPEKLEALGEALLDFGTIEDLKQWLQENL